MKDNKQPMKVWLAFDAVACFDRNEDCGAPDLKNHHHHIGPYVNLEQFMDEVESRAVKLFGKSFHNATMSECVSQSLKELAKEIMEGKA